MAEYKCYQCDKVVRQEYSQRKIRCPYCGSRVFFKTKTVPAVFKAR